MTNQNNSINWDKIIMKALMALIVAFQGWQYQHQPQQIKTVTRNEVGNVLIEKLDSKLDSVAALMKNHEFAEGVLNSSVQRIKGFESSAADAYLEDVFNVADEAIANHHAWQGEQLPFLVSQMNKRYLCPVQDLTTNEITMQGIGGDFMVRLGGEKEYAKRNKKLERSIFFFNDDENEFTPIPYLRKSIFKK